MKIHAIAASTRNTTASASSSDQPITTARMIKVADSDMNTQENVRYKVSIIIFLSIGLVLV